MTIPANARRLDAAGRYVTPGLWDAHVHVMNAGVTALPVLIAHGVTSVREMGGFLDSTRASLAARFVTRGTWYTPTLVVSRAVGISPATRRTR